MRLLGLLLCCGRAAGQAAWASLNTSAGTLRIAQNFTLSGVPLVVPPNTALLLVGDASACGGPCTVDASLPAALASSLGLPFSNFGSQHLRVGANANVTLVNLRLINGVGFNLPPPLASAYNLSRLATVATGALQGGSIWADAGSSVVLSGVEVAFGSTTADGGCVYAAGRLTLTNSSIHNCLTYTAGGGISVAAGGALALSGTVVDSCTAYGNGGCIVTFGDVNTVSSSSITNCFASGPCGGLYQGGGQGASIYSSLFANNTSGAPAGAVYNLGGQLVVINTSFLGNTGAGGSGGAVTSMPPTSRVVFSNCVFRGNSAWVRALEHLCTRRRRGIMPACRVSRAAARGGATTCASLSGCGNVLTAACDSPLHDACAPARRAVAVRFTFRQWRPRVPPCRTLFSTVARWITATRAWATQVV